MSVIKTTSNYELFKPIKGNRKIKANHVKKLVDTYDPKVDFPPIRVNKNMEVVDGQHRLEAVKQLKVPIRYEVDPEGNLHTVHALNVNVIKWTIDDYLESYIEKGLKDYKTYKEFRDSYKFGHELCIALLTGSQPHDPNVMANFKNGKFRIKDIEKAAENASKFNQIGQYYNGFTRRSFVSALMFVLANPHFDFDVFIKKVRKNPGALYHCANHKQYLVLIEEIYNRHNRNKTNLRIL